MRLLFGDLLPDDVLARTTKSGFDRAFWSEPSRAFAAEWDGAGADPELVDVEALRQEWMSPEPDPRSFTLLQAAWLASRAEAGGSAEAWPDGQFSGPVAESTVRIQQGISVGEH
jgi:asparagine synthase (glutamine-hydrolysing)